MNIALTTYLALHPDSRAQGDNVLYGSTGVVRRRTCTYCRKIIATSAATYPETKQSKQACIEHKLICEEKKKYQKIGMRFMKLISPTTTK